MIEYPKILAPFKRSTDKTTRNRMIYGHWVDPAMEFLAGCQWNWTEKIDGTNIRVHWDGHKVTYGGRTENAQIPVKLLHRLDRIFTEELFEAEFGASEMTLFGEGFGAGIQNGGRYTEGPFQEPHEFNLFDVMIDGFWLQRANLFDVANRLGVTTVPDNGQATLMDMITTLSRQDYFSAYNTTLVAEGMVGRPAVQMFDRMGQRIGVKLKHKDLSQMIRSGEELEGEKNEN
jgi:hypothetical protein